nr:F0F1 ATP synthase subunit epsilon [Buchnera aphidicola]
MFMKFHLDIVTVEKPIFSGIVKKIQISGSEGDMGIYPGHVQLLSIIKPGIIHIFHINQKEECLYVSGGVLEVQPSIVSILADIAIRGTELDKKRALEARKQAKKYLKNKSKFKNKEDVLLNIAKSIAQLRVLEIIDKFKNR